jgi:hypothetical protein
MAKIAYAMPELPGKDAHSVPAYCRENMQAYETSRQRAGITMERAYLMPTPMGNMVIGYIETTGQADDMLDRFAHGDSFERGFIDQLRETHGIDTSAPPQAPEIIGDWSDPAVNTRKHGVAFVAPIRPGQADAGRAFARNAYNTRRDEFTESRHAVGASRETVFLTQTPAGEMICGYIEGDDPAQANRGFAASHSPFDTWFKAECRTVFADGVDFDEPLPPIEEIWDWRAPAA